MIPGVFHEVGDVRVPYHFELTEKNTGINRSRGVDISRYQHFFSIPNSQKVRAVPRWANNDISAYYN